ncbi:Uncharacterised protein [Mycobacteroides abscessus subsp. abscessus]|nr:Uncharacterised protein [Mycobacteroides abscessus subsp. abscessus]SIG44593.1 Uncharacterised protein [Mycobacteroides abscessus subsp. abscessus]SIM97461.1 Uncharacterised protein [Mycobacteroides abscessus subsp. abscessus]SIN10277.1 Uncharacterised protein [Mycobacteroides abscessus subsp. abscessus]SIN15457.1 Uncharacterised protein [Mycobacteroides abscessus subsp. abscessus]
MSHPVPVDISMADQVAQLEMPIYHGTRVSMAERIMRDGFAPPPVSELTEAVAADHDVTVDALLGDLEAYKRFAVVDPRTDTVFTTGNAVKAGSWADRAPEATWEALWGVYRIRHPELGWDWNSSQEGHLWVLAQRLADPPAVLEAMAPLGAIRNRHGCPAAERFLAAIESGDPDAVVDEHRLFRKTPEWLVDPGDITARGFTPVSARVDDDLLLFLSGEDGVTFREQLRTNYWGEWGASAHPGDRPWHPFDQVWARLHGDRRAELEALVGVPITALLAAPAELVQET